MKRLFLIPASLLLAGCNATLEPGEPPPTPDYQIVFTSPTDLTLNVMLGGSGQVSAKVVDRRHQPITPDEGPTFRSTNSATLTMDADGHFTAVGWGTGPAAIIAEARLGSTRLSKTIGVLVSCTAELTVSLSPTAKSLAIGEHFTPAMSLTTCGGQVPVNTTVSWSASDATVLSVNPATGESTALNSGSANLQGYSDLHHAIVGIIPVTVR